MDIEFLATHRESRLPERQYESDAGFDLYAVEYVCINPGEFQDVSHGIQINLPPGIWAWIVGRSSALRTRGLMVNQGIIDNGYRGPLFTGVWNLTDDVVEIDPGERVSQLIPMSMPAPIHFRLGDPETFYLNSDRGEAGFGSSGN